MRNKAKLSLILLSAVLLSACSLKAPGSTNETADTNTEENQSTSLRDLIGMGKNQKCTISTSITDEDGIKTDTEGVFYISGKKMAQEYIVTSTDTDMPKVTMRMISDGEYMYTWNDENKDQGMKIKVTEPEDEDIDVESGEAQYESIDMDEKVDLKCTPWIVDNGKFTIPTDVTFTDLSEMMKNIPTMPAIPTGE